MITYSPGNKIFFPADHALKFPLIPFKKVITIGIQQ
jgi:hypothetical protein